MNRNCTACEQEIKPEEMRVTIDGETWHWRCVVRLAKLQLRSQQGRHDDV